MRDPERTDRQFSAGAQYGLIAGIVLAVSDIVFPRYGIAVVSAVLTVELAVGAAIVWRRTRMAIFSMGLCLASANLALMSGFAFLGHRFLDWLRGWIAVAIASWVVCFIATLVERRVCPREWEALKHAEATMSGWDLLLMRHIPDLQHQPHSRVS